MRQFNLILPVIAFLVAHLGASAAHGMYDPKHGRWLQRDREGLEFTAVRPGRPWFPVPPRPTPARMYPDGGNLYEYARSIPLTHVDAYGSRASLTVTTASETPGECGSYDVKWRFESDEDYLCYGYDQVYFVQAVRVFLRCDKCTERACKNSKKEPSETGEGFKGRVAHLMYWEAWGPFEGTPIQRQVVNDNGTLSIKGGCCGKSTQYGEVRTICSNKGDPVDQTIKDWNRGGDIAAEANLKCPDGKISWSAGILAWTKKRPAWWKNQPESDGNKHNVDVMSSSGYRSVTSSWNCCCNDDDRKRGLENWSHVDANP